MWKETYELLKRTFDGAPSLLTDMTAIDLVKRLHDQGELRVSINRGQGRGVLRIGNQRLELTVLDGDDEAVDNVSIVPEAENKPQIGLYATNSGMAGGPMAGGGTASRPQIMLDVDFDASEE